MDSETRPGVYTVQYLCVYTFWGCCLLSEPVLLKQPIPPSQIHVIENEKIPFFINLKQI